MSMNKNNIAKSLTIIFVVIATILTSVALHQNITKTDSYKFKKEYESLNGKKGYGGKKHRSVHISLNNKVKYSSAKEIIKKIDKGDTFIVYFGFSECPWCRSVIENLLEVARKKEVKTIYYVDVLNIRDVKEIKNGKIVTTKKGDKSYHKLVEKLASVLSDYELEDKNGNKVKTGEKRIYAPNIVAVVNGKVEKMEDGISPHEKDPYMKLTKKINTESKKEIECLLKCMEKVNVCTSKVSC